MSLKETDFIDKAEDYYNQWDELQVTAVEQVVLWFHSFSGSAVWVFMGRQNSRGPAVDVGADCRLKVQGELTGYSMKTGWCLFRISWTSSLTAIPLPKGSSGWRGEGWEEKFISRQFTMGKSPLCCRPGSFYTSSTFPSDRCCILCLWFTMWIACLPRIFSKNNLLGCSLKPRCWKLHKLWWVELICWS